MSKEVLENYDIYQTLRTELVKNEIDVSKRIVTNPLISRRTISVIWEGDTGMRMLREYDENRTALNRERREQNEPTMDPESDVGLRPSTLTMPTLTPSLSEPKSTPVTHQIPQQQQATHISLPAASTAFTSNSRNRKQPSSNVPKSVLWTKLDFP